MRKVLIGLIVLVGVLAILLSLSVSVCSLDFDIERKYESVFVIESGNSLGSGFAFGKNCIVTNAHVISDNGSILVTDYGGEKTDAELVFRDNDVDIALISVRDREFVPILPANVDELKAGDDVYAIGAPNSMAYTLTKGIVSSKNRSYMGTNYVQTDAAINHGNSGGPLLDNGGRVIGVNSMKISDAEGIGLAVSIGDVIGLLQRKGIALNDDGNINETLGPDRFGNETPESSPVVLPDPVPEEGKINPAAILIPVFLGLSTCAGAVLVIVFVYRKNRSINPKFDPKERTDFDIDIME